MLVLHRPSWGFVVQKMELHHLGVPGKDPVSLKVQLVRTCPAWGGWTVQPLEFCCPDYLLIVCFCHSFSRYSPSNCCCTIMFVFFFFFFQKTGFGERWFTSHYAFKILCTILSAPELFALVLKVTALKPIYYCIFPYMEFLVALLPVALQLFDITSEKALPSLTQENYPGVTFQGQSMT